MIKGIIQEKMGEVQRGGSGACFPPSPGVRSPGTARVRPPGSSLHPVLVRVSEALLHSNDWLVRSLAVSD